MAVDEQFGNFFKSEVRTSGAKLFREEKVSISAGSDTSVQAYVRMSPPVKVVLTAEGIDAGEATAACNCSSAAKAQFCKHVWAVLLATEEKYPDFLSAKTDLKKPETTEDASTSAGESYAEVAKARASEYRKEQYQRQKQFAKDRKRGAKESENARGLQTYPEPVASAIEYFTQNGFPMPSGPEEEILAEAKRKLSRVFHPDKGGSHAEMVELNERYDLLMRFLGA